MEKPSNKFDHPLYQSLDLDHDYGIVVIDGLHEGVYLKVYSGAMNFSAKLRKEQLIELKSMIERAIEYVGE